MGKTSPLFLFTLVIVTAIAPLAMQIFMPALPNIQESFGVSLAVAQLTVSVSMASIALATLGYGPYSDRYGRKPVMLFGLAFFLIGSAACTFAPDIVTLIVGRAVQAAGGAAGIVLTRAIVRDVFERDRVASVLAYLIMAMVVAPMLAPTIGGAITHYFGWRAIFGFLGLAGIGALALALRLPETHRETTPLPGLAGLLGSFASLLRSPTFTGYSMQGACSMAVFFTFASTAPHIVISLMGVTSVEYGLYFMLISVAFMGGNFVAARISQRVGVKRMVLAGSVLSLMGTLALAILVALWPTPWSVFAPAMVLAAASGLSGPNSMAGAINVNPRAAGAASGLTAFLQMMVGAIVVQIVGMLEDGTPTPMTVAMVLCAIASLVALVGPLFLERGAARPAAA